MADILGGKMDEFSYKHLKIDFLSQQILSHNDSLKLDPKAFSTLKYLISKSQRVVTCEELIEQVWDNRQINNDVVVSAIGRIRKLFKDAQVDEESIRTVHKVGYKFILGNSVKDDIAEPVASQQLTNSIAFHKKLNWFLSACLVVTGLFVLIHFFVIEKIEVVEQGLPGEAVSKNLPVTQIYFIRHADKESDGSDNPHLSEKGVQRATYWGKFFQYIRFDDIYTTDFHRNIETASLVSKDKGVKIHHYSPLSFDIIEHVEQNRGKTMLIIGHSNTIPDLINRLVTDVQYDPMSHKNYNLIYKVQVASDGNITSNLFHLEFTPETAAVNSDIKY